MILPPRNATDEEVAAWVKAAVQALDDTERKPNWRYRALEMSMGEALAEAPRFTRLTVKVPVGEMRIVRDVAKRREMPVDPMLRRAFGTWLVAVEGVDPVLLPWLTKGGILGP